MGQHIEVHEILREYWEEETNENIPTYFELLSNEEKDAITSFPEQLQKKLKVTSILEDIPEITRMVSKQQWFGRIKSTSLYNLTSVIELYYHTVGAGRYDEAYDLQKRHLLPNPLYFQFGAYQICIELLSALFEDDKYQKTKIKDTDKIAWLYNALANSYSLSGQPTMGVIVFKQALIIAKKRENKENLAIGLGNLASMAQIHIGDLKHAESNLRKRIEISMEINDKLSEAIGKSDFGKIKTYYGKFKESDTLQIESIKICKKINHIQRQSVNWSYRSHIALFQDKPKKALRYAQIALESVTSLRAKGEPYPRDEIRAKWLIGASYIIIGKVNEAKVSLQFAINECRKINLVEIESLILLEIAKLRHLQKNNGESLKLAKEALEIANRYGYVLQQADIHLFMAEYYRDIGDVEKSKEHAELGKLRSHQMIDVKTGDYITKPEDTKYKYKPCFDKAVKLISELGDSK